MVEKDDELVLFLSGTPPVPPPGLQAAESTARPSGAAQTAHKTLSLLQQLQTLPQTAIRIEELR